MTLYQPGTVLLSLEPQAQKSPLFLLPNQRVVEIFQGEKGGVPELSLIDWALETLLPEGTGFLDIGAHVGTYTLGFARSPRCTRVYSFEPQKESFYSLCAGVVLNGVCKKVEARNLALMGPETLYLNTLHVISEDGGGSSLLRELPTHQTPLRKEEVATSTLDSLSLSCRVGLVKIDVEGAELEVLQGAVKTLKRNGFPKILFESWNQSWFRIRRERVFLFLRELGYQVVPIRGYPQMFLAEQPEKEKPSEKIEARELLLNL